MIRLDASRIGFVISKMVKLDTVLLVLKLTKYVIIKHFYQKELYKNVKISAKVKHEKFYDYLKSAEI